MPPGYDRAAWQRVRVQALERARHRCQRCGRGARERVTLVVHHDDERGPLAERGLDLSNLTVMCRACHALTHGYVPRGAGGREG